LKLGRKQVWLRKLGVRRKTVLRWQKTPENAFYKLPLHLGSCAKNFWTTLDDIHRCGVSSFKGTNLPTRIVCCIELLA
jgi:hypothetical protein